MARDDAQIKIYVPFDMREQIKAKAEANSRSMNAEIVAAIEAALDQPDLGAAQLRLLLDEERESYTRLEMLYDNAFDLAMNYKSLLRSTKGRMLHFVSTLNSLASIIGAGGPPSEEFLDTARRVEASTSKEKALLEVELELVEGPRQAEEVQELMKKASALLNKPER